MNQPTPCVSLPSGPEHEVLTALTKLKNRKGNTDLSRPDFVGAWTAREERLALDSLIAQGFIARVEQKVYRVLVRCSCLDPDAEDFGHRPDARSIVPKALTTKLKDRAVIFSGSQKEQEWLTRTGMGESALRGITPVGLQPLRAHKFTSVYLAKYYFPKLCLDHRLGYFGGYAEVNWQALARQLKGLGPDMDYVRRLMDEFVKHPEWCRTTVPVWRVFLQRRHELAGILANLERKHVGDPSRHHYRPVRRSIRAAT